MASKKLIFAAFGLLVVLLSSLAWALPPPDLSIRNVEKTMLIADDPLYQCTVVGNSVVSREKILVRQGHGGPYLPSSALSRVPSQAAAHINNVYNLLSGQVVECGDACDIIYRGSKPIVEATPLGEVITAELFQKRGATVIEPTYDIVMDVGIIREDGMACSEWDFVNVNASFMPDDVLVMRVNGTIPIDYLSDEKMVIMVKEKNAAYIDLSVMEDTCWRGGESCLVLSGYEHLTDTAWDIYMAPTAGWDGFGTDTVIDPIIWQTVGGEVSTTVTTWQDRISHAFIPDTGGIYSVFSYSKTRAGGGAKDKPLPTRTLIDSVVHSTRNTTAIEDDINKEYNSFLSIHTQYMDETPHLMQSQYMAGESGKTFVSGNTSIAIIDPLTTTYLDDMTYQTVTTTNVLIRTYNFTLSHPRQGSVVVAFEHGDQNTGVLTVETYIDGSLYGNVSTTEKIAGVFASRFDMFTKEWTAGMHTVSVRAVASVSGKVGNVRVTPMFETDSMDIYGFSSRTQTMTTSTVKVEKTSGLFMTEAGKSTLIVASALAGIAPTKTVSVDLLIDGVEVCEDKLMTRKTDDSGMRQFGCLYNATLSAGPHLASMRFSRTTAGAENARIREAEILILTEKTPIVIPGNETGNQTLNITDTQALANAIDDLNSNTESFVTIAVMGGIFVLWWATGIPVIGIVAALFGIIISIETIIPISSMAGIAVIIICIIMFFVAFGQYRR